MERIPALLILSDYLAWGLFILMIPFSSLFGRVVKGLSKNSEALLVFGLGLVAIVLIYMKVNEWLACGMPVTLYMMYIGRQERSERHAVRMATHDLSRLEASRGASLAKAYGKKVKSTGVANSPVTKSKK